MKANRSKIIPVVKFTITTFVLQAYTNLFSKIIIVGQEVIEGINSHNFCWSTNEGSFSTDKYRCIFIGRVSDTIIAMIFLSKPRAVRREQPGELPRTTGGPWTTV
jgi:hypothetical protein